MEDENSTVVRLNAREQNLEEELGLQKIPQPPKGSLPALTSENENTAESLKDDVEAMYQIARDAYELSQKAVEESETMMDDKARASSLGNAITALNSAMAAVSQAARLKVKRNDIKNKEDGGASSGEVIIMDRNQMLAMLEGEDDLDDE